MSQHARYEQSNQYDPYTYGGGHRAQPPVSPPLRQTPAPAPAPQPAAKTRKWPWILGIVFAFLFGLGVGGAGKGSAPAASSSPSYSPPAASAPAAPSQAAPVAEEEPAAPSAQGIGEGDWLVGSEIQPGKYRSTGAKAGFFELCSASTKSADGNVMEWETANADEQVLITVSSKAEIFSNTGCEPFTKVG